ncbi:uncharacterized protein J3D65DRAFT_667991 [Phyllosticta citribraziliensis]|uniref:Uncharacterized protein n=1 Tax=Phyllosticta citribraziliensis TaxID=989973 RepID=A0ABR1LQ69_9PEZI
MSGPYRFPPERVTSPLDQRPVNLFPSGQPPNFKTNLNRNKTKKWVEAKPYSYDGDDWGDYDEDDEYGVSEQASKAPQAPTGLRQRGQSIEKGSRSFTDPQPGVERRNSFDYGDDKRAFSSSMGPMDALPPIDTSVQGGKAGSNDPHTRRDFEHSALPPPLQMRTATAPTSAPDTPLGHRPRTSSLAPDTAMPSAVSQDSTPISERQRAPSNPNKPLSFVRPADIYKRAVEGGVETKSPVEAKPQHEHLPGFEITKPPGQPASGSGGGVISPSLPPLHSGSTFGDEFWDSTQGLAKSGGESAQPELQHQPSSGFRSAVRAAFERKDDNSVPPTPVSKSNSLSTSGCNVSRSNTDSTAGISPIMSGVPGSGLPSLRTDTSTPAIAEEPSPSPRSASGTIQPFDPSQKPSTSHSRNPSGGTLPGASTPTGRPSSNHSPARSPAIEPARPVAAPAVAEMSADYGAREVDLASPPSKSSKSNSGLEELQAQASFLDSHRSPGPDSPERSSPISRSESPTKGRVRDLAGKLNEQLADSRRNSTHSISSQKSHDSGKKSSRPSSPTKSAERPQAEREISFRPKIPGTWESYNSTPGQSSPEKEKLEPPMKLSRETTAESFDIAPTTAKQQLDYKEPVDPIKNPTAALAATGAALGESIRSALSPGERSAESSSEDLTKAEDDRQARAVGDVWLRPLQVDRTNTSTTEATSKDSHLGDSPVDAPLPLRSSRSPSTQPEARTPLPRSKTIKDVESEALEQEIMKRLSNPSLGSLNVEPFNRAGSGLSQNWTSGEDDVQSLKTGLSVHDATIRPVEPSPFSSPERDDPGRPNLMKRFSWEQSSAGNSTAQQTPSKLLDSRENLADGLQLVNPEPESSPSPEPVELAAPAAPNQPLDADAWRAQSTAVDPAATLGERSTSVSQTLASTEQSRIPLFREILALKSSHERISKFNQTRESFASMDTGLRAWVAMTLEKKPEHAELADLPRNPPKPMSANSGSIRGHKHGASLSHIATGLRKTSQTATSESATTGAHPGASGAAGSSASASANRERMQAKGKDLLKGAGVLGGKGMKEAKGLFAKGRSRFGRNESKVD